LSKINNDKHASVSFIDQTDITVDALLPAELPAGQTLVSKFTADSSTLNFTHIGEGMGVWVVENHKFDEIWTIRRKFF